MPVYEFTCEKCQHRFEVLVRSSSASVGCPQCQAAEVRRLPSTFSSQMSSGKAESFCPPSGCGQCCGDPGLCMN